MKLIDMKLPKKSKKEMKDSPVVLGMLPEYPYGLQIELGKECLKKLGMSAKDFGIEKKYKMTCEVCCVGIRSNESKEREDVNVTLQIEKLALEKASGKTKVVGWGEMEDE